MRRDYGPEGSPVFKAVVIGLLVELAAVCAIGVLVNAGVLR